MKRIVLIGLAVMLASCGCARHYVVKFTNGSQVITKGKPKHVGNSYVLTFANGKQRRVSDGSVTLIEPASMEKKNSGVFTPETKP